jgi:shikimate dehydrogenase
VRAAVLGRPIGHSLSPVLHRAAYRALGLTRWSYEAIDCGENDLPGVLAARASGWAGFSCTMPLKRVVLSVADEVQPLAAAVGAANTLTAREQGGWLASTTDVTGIVSALTERAVSPAAVAVLGAGGTAQAALAALADLGIRRVEVLVRDTARTQDLRATAARVGVEVTVARLDCESPALRADLVISTLPPGAADPLAACRWTSAQALLDAVYDPWPTALSAAFEAAGAEVVSGALMLLHQACAQVELMTGRRAPVDAMRTALRTALPAALPAAHPVSGLDG